MAPKTRNGLRTRISYHGVPRDQLTRDHPSFDSLSSAKKEEVRVLSRDYAKFIDKSRIAPEVVDSVVEMAKENGFKKLTEQTTRSRNFYYVNEEGTAFALVKIGDKPISEGVRILYSHTDSPCLQIKPNPLLFEWDPDRKDHQLGVALDALSYGGINPHQWTGQDLELRGWSVINGKRIEVRLPVYSPEVCAHTDKRHSETIEFSDAHRIEKLDVFTGHKNIPSLLKRLKLNSPEDFSRAAFFVVPTNKPKLLEYYVSGYGHDNRSCVYTTVKALLDSNPTHTSIVLGFDKEEVGSFGAGSGEGGLFEEIYDRVLLRTLKDHKKFSPLEFRMFERDLRKKSIAVNADTDVGSNTLEMENGADMWNIAKLGFGVMILASTGSWSRDQISPNLIDRVYSILGKDVFHQSVGEPLSADEHPIESVAYLFANRGYQTVTIGPPVASLHSPSELIHIGDLAATYWAYSKILEAPTHKVKRQ